MTNPTARDTTAGIAAGVAVRGLTKSFRTPQGPVHAVRGIDLTIPAGQTVALLGPNGAGKSTTIDMVLGLARPDAGTVSLFGKTPSEAIKAGAVGAMLQVGGVIQYLSVRELITMVASLYPTPMAVDDVISITNIEDIAGRRTTKLSGGQTQRLRFAIALVSNPDLVVLDEPTVSLDVEARRDFWATMRAFSARGKTVVFATHYLAEADAYADRVVLMAAGRIIADGSASEIKSTVGLRTIRATLPGARIAELITLPGVTNADTRGDDVILNCTDSDAALRALIAAYPHARDFEVTGAGLEDAFVQLTRDAANDAESTERSGQEATR
jgi:ABC-2 type transport system ATP-binding protein